MKIKVLFTFLLSAFSCWASSTINSSAISNSAWGSDIGWINFRADNTNGAVIGESFCAGYIYSANVGWISLGDGTPGNGYSYSNTSAGDCGVNHDGQGHLRGYAYGANIGWINFESMGDPRVNLLTGNLSGYAYGANVGWISLSNSFAVVKTDSIFYGNDSDSDTIPDAWELSHVGNLSMLTKVDDLDGDGVSDAGEYIADTNPNDHKDYLQITAHSVFFSGVNDIHNLTWSSKPSRLYRFNYADDLNPGIFTVIDTLLAPDVGPTTSNEVGLGGPAGQRYLRVEAVRPLSP